MDEGEHSTHGTHGTLTLWAVCVAVLLGPAALVWIVRGAAYAVHCAPGPELCHGMVLGGGLRDARFLRGLLGSSLQDRRFGWGLSYRDRATVDTLYFA